MSDERSDNFDLKMLQGMKGYQKLQGLWGHEGALIMNSLEKAAAKGQESAWRYYAGIAKGFNLAITHLDRALMQMEKEGEGESEATKTVAELLKDVRGDQK